MGRRVGHLYPLGYGYGYTARTHYDTILNCMSQSACVIKFTLSMNRNPASSQDQVQLYMVLYMKFGLESSELKSDTGMFQRPISCQ